MQTEKNDFWANEMKQIENAQNLVDLTPLNFDEITAHTMPPPPFQQIGAETPPQGAPQPQQQPQGAQVAQMPMQQNSLNIGELLPPEMIGELLNATAPPLISKILGKYAKIKVPAHALRMDEHEAAIVGKTGHEYLKTVQVTANPLQVFVGVVVYIFGIKVISAMSNEKIETPTTIGRAVKVKAKAPGEPKKRKARPVGLKYKKSKIPVQKIQD
jgi:hypothetical protein